DTLAATAEVIGEVGYQGSRIEEICSRARISRGAFYHHFPSKEAAIVALIERNVERLLVEADRIERMTGDDRIRMIALEFAAAMRWIGSAGPIARAYFVDMLGVPEVQALQDRIERRYETRVWGRLEPLFESGELRTVDRGTTFRAFAGMTKEVAEAWSVGRLPSLDRAVAEVVRLALLGIGVVAE